MTTLASDAKTSPPNLRSANLLLGISVTLAKHWNACDAIHSTAYMHSRMTSSSPPYHRCHHPGMRPRAVGSAIALFTLIHFSLTTHRSWHEYYWDDDHVGLCTFHLLLFFTFIGPHANKKVCFPIDPSSNPRP